jgi:hypothetical protein
MKEGKIMEFTARTDGDPEEVLDPGLNGHAKVIDEEVVECQHENVHIRTRNAENGYRNLEFWCSVCDKKVVYKYDREVIRDVLDGRLELDFLQLEEP